MPTKHIPLAICYDFDGTLSPGYMQNHSFIPNLGIKPADFWQDVKQQAREQHGDEILIYMCKMLREAEHKSISVRRDSIEKYGETLELFDGVPEWFERINNYGRERGVAVQHHIISSGLREMIEGTTIAKHFKKIYASGFWYDHEGIAKFPALGVNYTNKTQFIFRINKGSLDVWDNDSVNKYIPPEERPVPLSNMIFFGDGETDIPCFRLVKDHGGHSIAVYPPHAKRRGKKDAELLYKQGRVNFFIPADYQEGNPADSIVKSIIEKLHADAKVARLAKRPTASQT